MSERSTDSLELLLPDAAPQFWQRAQKVTTFLRLLSGEARGRGDACVAVSLARARGEFERSSKLRAVRVHEELLRHHLYCLVGPDAFAHFGECEGELQEAWSELEELRVEDPNVPHVPGPGESAASVARRLVGALGRAGAEPARVDLWDARLRRAVDGPQVGAEAFEKLLARPGAAPSSRAPAQLRSQALAGAVECLLDRAAVRAARARLEDEAPKTPHAPHVLGDPRLRRLLLWARALAGDDAGARLLHGPASHARGRLPRPLHELRARAPAKALWFSGQVAAGELPPEPGDAAAPADLQQAAAHARTRLGAALFTAWVLEAPGRAVLAAHAVAPAHRGRWGAWREAREGACADPGEPEFRLLGGGSAVIEHFAPGSEPSPRGIDRHSVCAAALVPLANERGDVCGWLNLELEHHLVASGERLALLARRWSALLAPRAAEPVETVATLPAADRADRAAAPAGEDSLAAGVLRSFVEGLALKTAQRRWSAFEVQDARAVLVAQGGGALELEAEAPGAAGASRGGAPPESRAVGRAVSSGRTVVFTDADPALALHPEAASGVAVPLELRGKVAGVWLIESTRRRDFTANDVQRFEARAKGVARELAAARFRSWHATRFGHDVHVETARPVAGLSQEQLVALASSRTPVALSGAIGSGRRMLARRVHFEGRHPEAELRRLPCDPSGLERALSAGAEPASWLLERPQELPPLEQVHLAHLLEERAPSPARVFLILERPIAEAVERGELAPELAWGFSQVELRVAPLSRRRHEIAPLARLFAAHFAAQQGVRTPRLDDTAVAFLWRQPWHGNVRELAQWMYRLTLCHPADAVDGAALEALAGRLGHATLARLPSRHPDRELLLSALESTATGKGSWNKTRAALYLGWDTDTLQSRMTEAGLWGAGPGDIAAEPPAGPAPAPAAPALPSGPEQAGGTG